MIVQIDDKLIEKKSSFSVPVGPNNDLLYSNFNSNVCKFPVHESPYHFRITSYVTDIAENKITMLLVTENQIKYFCNLHQR